MKQFISRQQKIVVVCILQEDNKVLLLRGSQFADDENRISSTGYFDIPRFEIGFGEDPESMIKKRFSEYFNHLVVDVNVIDVNQDIEDEKSVQIFEVIYSVHCDKTMTDKHKRGAFFFADINTLNSYMLPHQHEYIAPYLRVSV